MPIDLYHYPGSAPCHAVRLVAAAVGVELNLKLLNPTAGEHLTPEFLKINPQHTIPTIDDNGFYLWESRAICTYLIEKYGKNDSLYPKDSKQRAIVNQRLYFDAGTFYQSFAQYLYPQVLGGEAENPAKLEKCKEAMDYLDKFLEGQNYVAGDHLTVADLSIVVNALCYTIIDIDMNKYKNIQRWMERIAAEAPKYHDIVDEGFKAYKTWIQTALKK
ncbi:glutathione S-transferase 1-like [Phymastichus coffea]|uniref:glutathione S-transferase 1-like n=1 Tax=Phymastichus coffea TaxID=108790 RepID=UPI00273C85AF|nr:glutathione S-transferase 1-like [Phymastichus coffea]